MAQRGPARGRGNEPLECGCRLVSSRNASNGSSDVGQSPRYKSIVGGVGLQRLQGSHRDFELALALGDCSGCVPHREALVSIFFCNASSDMNRASASRSLVAAAAGPGEARSERDLASRSGGRDWHPRIVERTISFYLEHALSFGVGREAIAALRRRRRLRQQQPSIGRVVAQQPVERRVRPVEEGRQVARRGRLGMLDVLDDHRRQEFGVTGVDRLASREQR
jgi:hypothetical protein